MKNAERIGSSAPLRAHKRKSAAKPVGRSGHIAELTVKKKRKTK